MALLTTKGIYALLSILEIAKSNNTTSINEISKKIGVSKGYLEQILNPLREKKLIKGLKGKNGGYYLNQKKDKITLLDIFKCCENDFMLSNLKIDDQNLQNFINQKNSEILDMFKISLEDFEKTNEENKKFLNFII